MNDNDNYYKDRLMRLEKDYSKLEKENDDLKYQNKELIKVIEGTYVEEPDDDFMDDPEFVRMEEVMDSAEKEDEMLNLYRNYIFYQYSGINWFTHLEMNYIQLRQTPLHIPRVENNVPIELCDDSDYIKTLKKYPHGKKMSTLHNRYIQFSDWAFNKAEPYPIDHYNDPEEVYEREDKILKAIASWISLTSLEKGPFHRSEYRLKSGAIVVTYADFYLWCKENPGATVWAYRFDNTCDVPHFYYSPEDISDVYRLYPHDEKDVSSNIVLGKEIRNMKENPNLELIIIPNDDWKNIPIDDVNEALKEAEKKMNDLYNI